MITLALIIAAAVLAAIAEFQAKGTSLLGWAVILISIALLMPRL